jgi:hypothetical protein
MLVDATRSLLQSHKRQDDHGVKDLLFGDKSAVGNLLRNSATPEHLKGWRHPRR